MLYLSNCIGNVHVSLRKAEHIEKYTRYVVAICFGNWCCAL